jgi:hypothetical protein
MGAGVSLPTQVCNECSLQFRASDNNLCCPRCGSSSVSSSRQDLRPPSLFLTPSGLMFTEETLRQLVLAHVPAAAGENGTIESLLSLLQNPGVLYGDRLEESQLLEVIARSIADGGCKQAPPASEMAWMQLRKFTWKDKDAMKSCGTDSEECAICLCKYESVRCACFAHLTMLRSFPCRFAGRWSYSHAVWARVAY